MSLFGRLRPKIFIKKACSTCSTIIFPHSANQIIDSWRRCGCCNRFQNSLLITLIATPADCKPISTKYHDSIGQCQQKNAIKLANRDANAGSRRLARKTTESTLELQGQFQNKTMLPKRWRSEILKFDIKQIDEGKIFTVKRLRSWRFERYPFVVTCRLDHEDDVSSVITFRIGYEDDVSSVSPSSSLAD